LVIALPLAGVVEAALDRPQRRHASRAGPALAVRPQADQGRAHAEPLRDLALQEAAGAEAVEQADLLGITAHLWMLTTMSRVIKQILVLKRPAADRRLEKPTQSEARCDG
jgi:hypothetical protein